MDSRGLKTSSMPWWASIPTASRQWERQWELQVMEPACQVATLQSHGGSVMVWCFAPESIGDLLPCTNLPQCNPVRRVAEQSPPTIYVFLSSTWKWSIPARQLLPSQVTVGYTAWLDEHSSDTSVMNWPPRSQYLNHTERFWDSWRKVWKQVTQHQCLLLHYGQL